MNLRRRFARVAALFRQRRLDRELEREIAAHLEMAEHDARTRGLDPVAARQLAMRQFGGVDQMKEHHRDERSIRWAENIVKDVRYGLAGLRRDPLFAAVAISVLALGIGANIAVFSLVDAALFRPLPFPEPERLARWWEAPTSTTANSTTALNFNEIARLTRSFEALSAEARTSATAVIEGEPVRLQGRLVSADHFTVFGIHPMLGRAFTADEDRAGGPTVVVLSHAAWQTQFGGDPTILQRTIALDNVPHQIVGVMPPGAFDRDRARPQDDAASFWKPQAFTEAQLSAGLALAQSRRPPEAWRLDRRRPGRSARGTCADRRHRSSLEEGLECGHRALRRPPRGAAVPAGALRGARCGAGGSGHRVR